MSESHLCAMEVTFDFSFVLSLCVFSIIATTEASFSCAWNQSSEKFAVASQDGFVSVWDIRHSEKLCKLGSKQVNPWPLNDVLDVHSGDCGLLSLCTKILSCTYSTLAIICFLEINNSNPKSKAPRGVSSFHPLDRLTCSFIVNMFPM